MHCDIICGVKATKGKRRKDEMEIYKTDDYTAWEATFRDGRALRHVAARVRQMSLGNFSDAKSVGEGVMETRIHYGPGYRLYYTRRGGAIVVLLVGGDKSTQRKDIARAKELARNI